ncbi:NAD(P)H-dependent oxidoreductase [Rhodococcus sp. IEGM 1381]|uniref:FMN-dependent NADH-azoreductase n=1 Tax=Rhodococcus sp. IEGM 1381 TaxID=3047085 RepID=UPI0024B6B3A1|nr:NAD(P)H-dependent oxidoreductase [Rhodococcus sp. IEGM 1381]MDI9893172.1 NAD(P)H-dependent oxidoreductase [Rhodococcus sp. IEGM 1381]
MKTVLVLDSSADPAASVSRELTEAFMSSWRAREGAFAVVYRDLHALQLPHLPHPAFHWAPEMRDTTTQLQPEVVALQNELLEELIAADAVVVAVPMYNWSVPSTLKAWIDYVHVLGVTTPVDDRITRPLSGRPALIVSSRGDEYGCGTANPNGDHAVPPVYALLSEAFGMSTEVVTADLTLARTLGELSHRVEDSDTQRQRAKDDVVRTAHRWFTDTH